MRIAVFSGSFDPLHKGHKAIMECLSASEAFDWVYLVLSPQSPFKERERALTAKERFDAAADAVSRHPGLHVWVDDIELTMTPPDYTIRTLDALKEREPDNEFTLVIGADNLENFSGWNCYDRILLEYGLVVYPREGYDLETLKNNLMAENPAYRIELLAEPLVVMSSTEIREMIVKGLDVSEYLM